MIKDKIWFYDMDLSGELEDVYCFDCGVKMLEADDRDIVAIKSTKIKSGRPCAKCGKENQPNYETNLN